MTLHQRMDLARQRLTEALKAGDDTSAHRAAIAQLEADLARQAEADQATRANNDRQRQADIEARAKDIADETRAAIAHEIAQLDMDITQ